MSIDSEIAAEIRNNLQAAQTVLELLNENRDISKERISKAIKDLDKILSIISK